MIYTKRYVQFNDMVIDGFDMIDESSVTSDLSFKDNSQPYSYGHGDYDPYKRDYQFAEAATVSMTLYLRMKKLMCEDRPFYRRFVIGELSKPGKLWAVQNGELLWAWAKVTNYGEPPTLQRDTLEINLDFKLKEGIWHKADPQKTFLKPYDICSFMDCYNFQTYQPCRNTQPGECCTDCGGAVNELSCSCCECETICKDWALCYHLDELSRYYGNCDAPFQILYDCDKAQEFFGDEFVGQKICNTDPCSEVIAGRFYADTDIPTGNVDLIINGDLLDPAITINGNTNIIEGEYRGQLIVKANGDIYSKADECCPPALVPPQNWTVPAGSEYGWTVYPGGNGIIINSNICCGTSCVYIQVNGETY